MNYHHALKRIFSLEGSFVLSFFCVFLFWPKLAEVAQKTNYFWSFNPWISPHMVITQIFIFRFVQSCSWTHFSQISAPYPSYIWTAAPQSCRQNHMLNSFVSLHVSCRSNISSAPDLRPAHLRTGIQSLWIHEASQRHCANIEESVFYTEDQMLEKQPEAGKSSVWGLVLIKRRILQRKENRKAETMWNTLHGPQTANY